jgi:hypothetical protein
MRVVLIFVSILFLPQFVFGQDGTTEKNTLKKNTIGFSYSGPSFSYLHTDKSKPIIIEGKYGYKAIGYNHPVFSGIFSLSYSYNPIPRMEVGVGIGYEQERRDWMMYNSVDGPTKKIEQNHYLYIMPNASFIYISRNFFEMYSSLEMGTQHIWSNLHKFNPDGDAVNEWNFAAQFWLLGLRFKYKSWAFYIDQGGGSLGLVRFGLNIRL